MAYEISLAYAITTKFGHALDYVLHYALYIGLFYFHCYGVLHVTISGEKKRWLALFSRFMAELALFVISGALISMYLELIQVERRVSIKNASFIYGTIYRCIYITGLSTAYWFVLHLFRKQKRIHRLQRAKLTAAMAKEKLKIQTEAALLKATINPHMLFNTLNFLYNEVRKIDKPVADHIMSLSELMRFALTDISREDKVTLNDEVVYLENYIHLYKQRIPSNIILVREGTSFDFQQKIIPLLLATLVENIFQHGDLAGPDKPASIMVSCKSGLLVLQTENKIRQESNAGHGLGLINLEKRLQYAYPNSYRYTRHVEGNTYKTFLKIDLNNSGLC